MENNNCTHTLVEKRKYTRIWANKEYRRGSPAERVGLSNFIVHFKPEENERLIDFGCGTGRAAKKLSRTLAVTMIDIAENCLDDDVKESLSGRLEFVNACLWNIPENVLPAHYIFSCDVLEHIPTEHVDSVLDEMARLTIKGGYLQICTRQDFFGKTVNEVLHLTVKPFEWWKEKIVSRWELRDSLFDAKSHTAIFYIGEKNHGSK